MLRFSFLLMAHKVISAALCIAAMQRISLTAAFSAKLPRPWELPSTASMSLTRRRRRWDDLALQATSVPAQSNLDSDDTAKGMTPSTEDEEDTMMLQTSKDSTPEVIISISHSNMMPVSSAKPPRTAEQQPTVASSLKPLFGMTRPSNFPGIVILHILGVYLAIQSPFVGSVQLLPALARPCMMIVLCCLLLTSAASMVVS